MQTISRNLGTDSGRDEDFVSAVSIVNNITMHCRVPQCEDQLKNSLMVYRCCSWTPPGTTGSTSTWGTLPGRECGTSGSVASTSELSYNILFAEIKVERIKTS